MKSLLISVNTCICVLLVLVSCSGNRDANPETAALVSPYDANEIYAHGLSYVEKHKYDSALYLFLQSADNHLLEENFSGYFNAKVKAADAYRLSGDPPASDSLLKSIESEISNYPAVNRSLQPDILHLRGALKRASGQNDSAIDYYMLSVDARIRNSGENDTLLIPTYNNIGNIFYSAGYYDEATDYYSKAIGLFPAKRKQDRLMGIVYQNMAIIYSEIGSFLQADSFLVRGLALFSSILEPDDIQLASFHNVAGISYIRNSNFQAAQLNLLLALDIYNATERDATPLLAEIYHNLGVVYNDGYANYQSAFDNFRSALHVISTNPDFELLPYAGSVRLSAAKAASDLNKSALAMQIAAPLTDGVITDIMGIRALLMLANLNASQKAFAISNRQFIEVINSLRRIDPDDIETMVLAFNGFGFSLTEQGDYEPAIEKHANALQLLKSSGAENSGRAADIHCYLARLYKFRKEFSKAFIHIGKAVASTEVTSARGSGSLETEFTSGSFRGYNRMVYMYEMADILYQMAVLDNDRELLKPASDAIVRAIDYLESYNPVREATSTSDFVASVQEDDIYTLAMEIAWMESQWSGKGSDQVYLFFEKSKGRSLLNLLRAGKAIQSLNIPDSLQLQEKALQADIMNFERLATTERQKAVPNAGKISYWENLAVESRRRHNRLMQMLNSSYPEYSSLIQSEDVLDIHSVKERLASDEGVLAYALSGDTALFVFTITRKDFNVSRVKLPANFHMKIMQFWSLLSSPDLTSQTMQNLDDYQHKAFSLYRFLVEPFYSSLKDKRLLIIPDGIIGYIPFEALVTGFCADCNSYRSLNYLLKENAVSYSYSYTLRQSVQLRSYDKFGIAAFAPEYVVSETGATDPSGGMHSLLKPIPGAMEEIRSIRRVAGNTKIVTGSSATEAAFRKLVIDPAVLHFAMHTVIEEANPMYSRLVFSGKAGDGHDNLLHAYELSSLRMKARMVVLSACNSGFGLMGGREGVISLTREFFSAGVPTVVMSHWTVEDESGSRILPLFYSHLTQKLKADDALRLSKLNFLESSDNLRAHPYFWSTFVVYGNTDPIELNPRNNKQLYYITLLAILLLASAFFLKKGLMRNNCGQRPR